MSACAGCSTLDMSKWPASKFSVDVFFKYVLISCLCLAFKLNNFFFNSSVKMCWWLNCRSNVGACNESVPLCVWKIFWTQIHNLLDSCCFLIAGKGNYFAFSSGYAQDYCGHTNQTVSLREWKQYLLATTESPLPVWTGLRKKEMLTKSLSVKTP